MKNRYLAYSPSIARFKHLRTAVDWQDWHYSEPIKQDRYLDLRDGGEFKIAGTKILFRSHWTDTSLILQGEGYFIRLTNPAVFKKHVENGVAVIKPPIQIQCQGHAFAGGVDVFKAARDIESILSLPMGVKRIPGRIDIACDVWIKDPETDTGYAAREIYETIICGGDKDRIKNNWSMKARRIDCQHTMIHESRSVSSGGSTSLYLGNRSLMQLCVYNKSADFAGNTKDIVLDEWEKQGYEKGSGLVVRFEYRISRQFLRKSIWNVEGKGIPGSEITLEDLYKCISQLWATCVQRIRYCPDSGKKRADGDPIETRKRDIAPAWNILMNNGPVLEDEYQGPLLRYQQKGYDVKKLEDSTVHYLMNMVEACGAQSLELMAQRALADTEENREYKEKTRWKNFKQNWKDSGVIHGKLGSWEQRDERKKSSNK